MRFPLRSARTLTVLATLALGLTSALAQTNAPAAGAQPSAAAQAQVPAAVPPPQSTARAQSAPATAPAASSASPAPLIDVRLPRDLSPWGMFMAADIVVKLVMIGLAFASLLTWTIWFAKGVELTLARRRMRRAIAVLAKARSLADCLDRFKDDPSSAGAMVRAAEAEIRMSADALDPTGIKERVASRLERLEAAAGRAMIRGTGLLATIGATAPFVGLFGTVWGIMNSFIGISKSHTTNLAVVAPGIAEALLATALGLAAAIPAVVMYNMFSRWTATYRAIYADTSAEILRLVGRDLDRGAYTQQRRRAAAAE